MAAGSVMKEPMSGPSPRMESHQAAGLPPPRAATLPSAASATAMTGRVEARAMITTTKTASVKTTVPST